MNMMEFASTLLDLTSVIVSQDSKADDVKSTSTNANPVLAKMRGLVLMNEVDSDASVCQVSQSFHFDF